MQIKKLLTPYNYSSGTADRIKYIVIHYVGALGGAEANCKYYASQYIGASAHYYVGFNGEIWQSVEDQNIAWHCGAKAYIHPECRNTNSIGIEMCVRNNGSQLDTSLDWYFEEVTIQSTIKLTKELMKKYNIPADHVIRHYDVTGKICPNPYVYNHTKYTWDSFKAALKTPSEYVPGWNHDKNGWWYAVTKTTYHNSCWQTINGHKYYFNPDGYAVTNWQALPHPETGEMCYFYFEPRAKHELECALYISDKSGAQHIGRF